MSTGVIVCIYYDNVLYLISPRISVCSFTNYNLNYTLPDSWLFSSFCLFILSFESLKQKQKKLNRIVVQKQKRKNKHSWIKSLVFTHISIAVLSTVPLAFSVFFFLSMINKIKILLINFGRFYFFRKKNGTGMKSV